MELTLQPLSLIYFYSFSNEIETVCPEEWNIFRIPGVDFFISLDPGCFIRPGDHNLSVDEKR
jgi:hypothetical protein